MSAIVILCSVLLICVTAHASAASEQPLYTRFENPPPNAKLKTWWHWLNGNIDRDCITDDLEAMAAQGYGGLTISNVGLSLEEADVTFRTEKWMDHLEWTAKEYKRLGLDLGIHNCDGWSQSFGPWIKTEQSMKKLPECGVTEKMRVPMAKERHSGTMI